MAYPFELVGLEVECTNVFNRDIQSLLNPTRAGNKSAWFTEHDASIESDVYFVPIRDNKGIIVLPPLPEGLNGKLIYSGATLGTEIVCNPPFSLELGLDEIKEKLESLFEALNFCGEPTEGQRNSVHIHISCPNSLKINKTILRLGRYTEALFFAIGCQGYRFRGELANSSAYCRPITKWGPPVTRTSRTGGLYVQVMDIDNMLECITLADFWSRMGNAVPNNPERYHPARYVWLNLYSLLTHGSLEFRVFNYTNNIHLLLSEICLCQAFVNLALRWALSREPKALSLGENSVYDGLSTENLIELLHRFAELADSELLTSNVLSILENCIIRSPRVELPEGYIMSHVTERAFGRSIDYTNLPFRVKYIPEREIEIPVILDIHRLRGERG